MKTTGFLKTVALSAVLLVSSVAVSARNYDNNLIYNSEEENGMLIGPLSYFLFDKYADKKISGRLFAGYLYKQ